MEQVKELRPGCWVFCTWVVTVTGGEQRKKLVLELKPLISGRNDLGGVEGRWLEWPGLRGHGEGHMRE